jgi:hypothetical protein
VIRDFLTNFVESTRSRVVQLRKPVGEPVRMPAGANDDLGCSGKSKYLYLIVRVFVSVYQAAGEPVWIDRLRGRKRAAAVDGSEHNGCK